MRSRKSAMCATREAKRKRATIVQSCPASALIAGALGFLLVASVASLSLPSAVGQMIDHGFSKANAEYVDI